MTIQQLILKYLKSKKKGASMGDIDQAVWPDSSLGWSTSPETIRARVYELVKAGKVVRIARGTYALPKSA